MFKLLAVTNRRLCREPFLERVEKIAASGADGLILREKDLQEWEYGVLAKQVLAVCRDSGIRCILHSFPQTALHLGTGALHLPLPVLRALTPELRQAFSTLGASCHSLSEVQEAEALGCTYVTLGHIFATDCKKGLAPRGLGLLEAVCREARLPVYAIGGITKENLAQVRSAGAAGACIMSGLMGCEDPAETVRGLRAALSEGEVL